MKIIHYVVGRQVGKTTKIVDMVKTSKSDVNLIVTHNDNMRRHISDLLRHRPSDSKNNVYRNGGTRIIGFHNLQYEMEHLAQTFDKTINVYFDELISCVEKSNSNIVVDFIQKMGENFDHVHSNVIAFSTPIREYRMIDYINWQKGNFTLFNHIFENALLSVDYVSNKIPNCSMNEDKLRDVISYKLKNGEPMDRISLEHFAKFI